MRIGSKEFKNKKEALNYYKEILNSYKFGETLNDKDKQYIIDLLSIRPDFETKFCNGFKQIYVDKIPKYNSKAFFVLDNNSELEVFSYIKCINGSKPPLTKFSCTCRDIIQDDIKNSKRLEVIRTDLVANEPIRKDKGDVLARSLVRHDPKKLAKELYKIFNKSSLSRFFSTIFSQYID